MKTLICVMTCFVVAVAFVSCEPKKQPAEGESGTPSAGGAGVTAPEGEGSVEGTTKAPVGLPDTSEAVKAAEKKVAEVTEAAEDAKEAASETMEELAKVAESTFSLEKLQGLLGSLSTENLTQVADNLLGALQDQQGIVKGLQDRIANLGIADALKAPELKKQLESALSVVSGLKAKLSSVVSSLTEKGVDVSKYTAILGG